MTSKTNRTDLFNIDTDKLLSDFPKTHNKEKQDLETIAKGKVIIVWQDKNHEDELDRATKGKIKLKNGMKGKLNRHSNIVINSTFVKDIFKHFKDNDKP
ncbi:MAG: hypothetical protein KBC22_03310 [Candidatus Pacebacteria bacterium]|nr:hypothetical protein [Candidatus Paceibacterota bacterium]